MDQAHVKSTSISDDPNWVGKSSSFALTMSVNIPANIFSPTAWNLATNTPQQIRMARTLCAMMRCLLGDSCLSPHVWRECMLTAAYLCNLILHTAPHMGTPHKGLYRKDANLSYLKVQQSSDIRPGKGCCVG